MHCKKHQSSQFGTTCQNWSSTGEHLSLDPGCQVKMLVLYAHHYCLAPNLFHHQLHLLLKVSSDSHNNLDHWFAQLECIGACTCHMTRKHGFLIWRKGKGRAIDSLDALAKVQTYHWSTHLDVILSVTERNVLACWGQHWDKATHIIRYSKTGLSWTDLTHSLQKVPEFPVWTTCQKPVEYIKFPINFPIMESQKNLSSQTILEFGMPMYCWKLYVFQFGKHEENFTYLYIPQNM